MEKRKLAVKQREEAMQARREVIAQRLEQQKAMQAVVLYDRLFKV